MSLLYRNGTGRNNIAWGGGTTTSGKYLRRTGTSRNSISFIQISSNGTWNILNRTSSGRNNIQWKNTTFNFKKATIEGLFEPFLNDAGAYSSYVYYVGYVERINSYRVAWSNNGSYIYPSYLYTTEDDWEGEDRNKIIIKYSSINGDNWLNKYSYLIGDKSFTIRTLVNADNTGDGHWESESRTATINLFVSDMTADTALGMSNAYTCTISFLSTDLNPSDDAVDFNYAIFQKSRFYLD